MSRPATKSSLKKHCNKVFSHIVRKTWEEGKYKGRCPTCIFRGKGYTQGTEACHIFSRSHLATLWDEGNAYWGCSGCNILYELDAGFANRIHEWWKEYKGQDNWDRIERLWHTTTQMSKNDFEDKLRELTECLEADDGQIFP